MSGDVRGSYQIGVVSDKAKMAPTVFEILKNCF
jgi:hypothetical protein